MDFVEKGFRTDGSRTGTDQLLNLSVVKFYITMWPGEWVR